MKKKCGKFLSIVLVLSMVLGMMSMAFADPDETKYTITIQNAVIGQTYSAYQIFDATYASDEDGNVVKGSDGSAIVSYTLTNTVAEEKSSNPWYDLLSADIVNDDETVEYATPFVFTAVSTEENDDAVTTVYSVTVGTDEVSGEAYSDVQIIEYLNAAFARIATYNEEKNEWIFDDAYQDITAAASATASATTLTLDVGACGYYYITSTLGAVVSITTADPAAVVMEKNNPPGNVEKGIVLRDKDGNITDVVDKDSEGDGDEVEFLVTAEVPLYAPYDESLSVPEDEEPSLEGYLVYDYSFTDHMSAGLDIEGLTTQENATAKSDCEYYTAVDDDGVTHYYATNRLINMWVQLTEGDTTYYLCDGYDSTGTANEDVVGVAYNVVLELYVTTAEAGEHVSEDEIYFDGFSLTYDTIDQDAYAALVEARQEQGLGNFETAYDLISALQEYEAEDYVARTYPTNAQISIDYTAHMTGLADYDNTNDIEMMWLMTTFRAPTPDWENPQYSDGENQKDDVFIWELVVKKVDAANESKVLEGAEFSLTGDALSAVVVSKEESWAQIERYEDYKALKEANEEASEGLDEIPDEFKIYFLLSDGTFTSVDPYDLDSENDAEALAAYVVNEYYGVTDPEDGTNQDYYGVGDYKYVAYTFTRVKSQTTVPVVEDDEGKKTISAATGSSGEVTFTGLNAGTYTLSETAAPDGYNLMPDDITIEIEYVRADNGTVSEHDGYTVTVYTGTKGKDDYQELGGVSYEDGVIEIVVEDNAGTELPGTGGIGTTIFYIVGAILILGAIVLLVVRGRKNQKRA